MTYWCVEKLGRLPSELSGFETSELMKGIFMWGMVAEEVNEELNREVGKGSAPTTVMSPLEGVY